MRRLCVPLISCLLVSACGGGGGGGGGGAPPPTTLYVRTSGNDANTGSSPDKALKTVVRAAGMLVPGMTVYVGPGHYKGRIDISGVKGSAQAPVQLIADSTGAHTTDPAGDVVLDADGDLFTLRLSGTPFATVDGFVIIGAQPGTNTTATGIHVRSTSPNVTIRNCQILDGGPADGIRVQNSTDVVIFNNLIVDNNRGIRIADGSQRARVLNNTIVDNRSTGVSIGGADSQGVAPTDATVRNNIIQDNRNNVSISVDDGPPSSRVGYSGNYNLSFVADLTDQTKAYRPSVLRGDNDVNEDALFIDTDHGDFHIDTNSPAVDAGTGALDPLLLNQLFQRSTALDGSVDVPPVDLGYHFAVETAS
jgi:parallel beta-helix repeat protein